MKFDFVNDCARIWGRRVYYAAPSLRPFSLVLSFPPLYLQDDLKGGRYGQALDLAYDLRPPRLPESARLGHERIQVFRNCSLSRRPRRYVGDT